MHEVLSVLETKEDYRKYRDLVFKHCNDNDLKRIVENIDIYYRNTAATEIKWDEFSTWFFVQNPLIQSGKQAVFEGMFKSLGVPGSTIKSDLISTYMERYHAERISFLAMEIAEGRKKDLSIVRSEFDDYMRSSGKIDSINEQACLDDLSTLLKVVAPGSGYRWRSAALNEALGELVPGKLLCFNGRPEAGKTTLMCSEATYIVRQLPSDKKVLYFTNEEGAQAVKTRMYCALLGVDLPKLQKNMALAEVEYAKRLGGDRNKILVIDKHDLHINDIEYWVEKENPALICIDQLRKVHGFEDMKGVQRLEKLFQYAREIAKSYAPVMTVGQLGDLAEGKQYPTMDMLYESRTAIQGECDVIINIGQVPGSVPEYARWLNIVKNKMPMPGDPKMRHGKYEVLMLPDIARYSG